MTGAALSFAHACKSSSAVGIVAEENLREASLLLPELDFFATEAESTHADHQNLDQNKVIKPPRLGASRAGVINGFHCRLRLTGYVRDSRDEKSPTLV